MVGYPRGLADEVTLNGDRQAAFAAGELLQLAAGFSQPAQAPFGPVDEVLIILAFLFLGLAIVVDELLEFSDVGVDFAVGALC